MSESRILRGRPVGMNEDRSRVSRADDCWRGRLRVGSRVIEEEGVPGSGGRTWVGGEGRGLSVDAGGFVGDEDGSGRRLDDDEG